MSDASPPRHDKFRAYRARKKAAGLKQVRLWAIDTSTPGFQGDLDRACHAINLSEDSLHVQAMMNELNAEVWNDLP